MTSHTFIVICLAVTAAFAAPADNDQLDKVSTISFHIVMISLKVIILKWVKHVNFTIMFFFGWASILSQFCIIKKVIKVSWADPLIAYLYDGNALIKYGNDVYERVCRSYFLLNLTITAVHLKYKIHKSSAFLTSWTIFSTSKVMATFSLNICFLDSKKFYVSFQWWRPINDDNSCFEYNKTIYASISLPGTPVLYNIWWSFLSKFI